MGNKTAIRGSQGKPGAKGPQAGSLQARSRLHYASHNSGSLAMAGANIQGQGRSTIPNNTVDAQRFSGVVGTNM